MKKLTTLFLILAALMAAGCGTKTDKDAILTENASGSPITKTIGSLLLSINPEIEIGYDENGMVLSLEGENEDGKKVLSEYTDYKGKTCETVIDELVKKIYADGYFEKKVDGHEKNIIIKLEDDSVCPDESFMENLEQTLQDSITECRLTSAPILIDEKDLDTNGLITPEKAKEIVLSQLGLSDAQFIKVFFDPEDQTYEMKFTVDDITYEFEVNASNGKVIESETDTADDIDDGTDSDTDDTDDDDSDDMDDDPSDDDDTDDDDDADDTNDNGIPDDDDTDNDSSDDGDTDDDNNDDTDDDRD